MNIGNLIQMSMINPLMINTNNLIKHILTHNIQVIHLLLLIQSLSFPFVEDFLDFAIDIILVGSVNKIVEALLSFGVELYLALELL